MDVVPDARAVLGRIVVAEHVELFELADRDLRDVGHKVVGDAVGILADESALVRADGVEVAQNRDVHRLVRLVDVAQDVLDHQLGRAVRVGRRQREILFDGHALGLTVDGRRRREDEILAAVFSHHRQEHEGADEVVGVIFKRFLHRFADRLKPGEVDDRVGFFRLEDAFHRLFVADVRAIERELFAGDLAHAVEHRGLAVDEVVYDDDLEVVVEQIDRGVRADVAGSARNQNFHDVNASVYALR